MLLQWMLNSSINGRPDTRIPAATTDLAAILYQTGLIDSACLEDLGLSPVHIYDTTTSLTRNIVHNVVTHSLYLSANSWQR